jgi:hypothetical protein
MTSTENLKKHIEDLEKRRLALFFHMQKIAIDINARLYGFNTILGICAIAIFVVAFFALQKDAFFLLWSKIFALITIVITLTQHLYILDRVSTKIYRDICAIYTGCDDEYFVLKKYNIGELDERLIRQFYVNKTHELERYTCTTATPGWLAWLSLSSFLIAIILLFFA